MKALEAAIDKRVGPVTVIAFTTDDQVNPGSCAKAMTSTRIATLVAEGELNRGSKLITEII